MNWGAPFVIAFIFLLIAAATELSIGATGVANSIAVYGFYSLVVGIALQIASYIKYGESDKSSPQTAASEAKRAHVPKRLPRRTMMAAVATVGLIMLAAVVIGYPGLVHPGPVTGGASLTSPSSSSGCGGPRNDGTLFISTNATVSITVCSQSYLIPAGTGGGYTYSYHAGIVNFTAPSSVNGSAFEFWYAIVGSNAPARVTNTTMTLNLPLGLTSQNSLIQVYYAAPLTPTRSTTLVINSTSSTIPPHP